MTTRAARHALKVDARNRAWRTLLQGLATDVLVAIRDDVNAALADAGSGASADQIADELAARLAVKGE